MRIGFFTSIEGWGGSEVYLDTMIAGVTQAGHQAVLFGVGGTRLARLCQDHGVPVVPWRSTAGAGGSDPHERVQSVHDAKSGGSFKSTVLKALPWPLKLLAGNIREALCLARLFRVNRVDVMHVNVHGYETAGVACRLAGIPSVGVYHIWPPVEPGCARRFLIWATARSYDLVVAPCDAALCAWVKMYGLDEKRCRSVLNGIDMKRFAEPRVQGCTNSFRLLSLGRLDDNKDVATLLDAVVLLSDIDITVTIAGDGPKRDALVERAETMGIMDRVKFVGHVEDVGGLYQEADCFVMPSRSEACPLALMEAMAAGLPSVTSDGGSLPYLNMDGITGRVFPVGNARECATAIAELAKNRQHAATMGAEAARRAARDFSVGRMTIAMTHIYADLSCGNIGANGIAR